MSRELMQRPSPERREQVIEALKNHFAAGDLDVEELERRLEIAQEVATVLELVQLLEDLPAPRRAAEPHEEAPPPARRGGVVVAILGGASRGGRWMPPAHLNVVSLMGGTALDFREAVIPRGGTTIDVMCVMGGVEITVPPGLPVQVDGLGLMGAFEDRTSGFDIDDKPRLRIRGVALMGGVEVREKEAHRRGGREIER
jgi:hypothetical protein